MIKSNQLANEDSKNRWATPRIVKQIKDMESILAILQNPYLQTPIADMGLPAPLLNDIQEDMPEAEIVFDLLTNHAGRKLRQELQTEVWDKAQLNGLPAYFEFLRIFGVNQHLIDSSHHENPHPDQTPKIQISINDAKAKLEALQEERDREIKNLHFVTIIVPSSVSLNNNDATIREAARASLAENFTATFNAYSTAQVNADLDDLYGVTAPTQGIFERFRNWLSQMNEGVTMLETFRQPFSPPSVHTMTFEFAVRAVEKDGFKPSDLRELIFNRVAHKLSGLGLTEDICHRLDAAQKAVQPAPQATPYDWIEISTPQQTPF